MIQNKDITSITSGIILHQCNCQGVMGSGVAGALKKKWPIIHSAYIAHCSGKTPEDLLGTFCEVEVKTDLIVVNCLTQLNYGYDGKLYTDYKAISKVFREVYDKYIFNGFTFYAPYNYGCGLGGGDWDKVSKIFINICPDIIFCKL